MALTPFEWQDPFSLTAQLSDDERMIMDGEGLLPG